MTVESANRLAARVLRFTGLRVDPQELISMAREQQDQWEKNWARRHPSKRWEYTKRWRQRNPEKVAASCRRTRERRKLRKQQAAERERALVAQGPQ